MLIMEYLRIYRAEREVGGIPRGPQARGPAPLGCGPVACGALGTLLTSTPSSVGVFWSKKNHHESFITFGLRLIFLFCETQNKEKQKLALGSRLIG
jgi:hypothetical protein